MGIRGHSLHTRRTGLLEACAHPIWGTGAAAVQTEGEWQRDQDPMDTTVRRIWSRPHLLPVGCDDANVASGHLAGDAPGQQAAVAHDLHSLSRIEP